jgi:hypothetical protein
MLLQAFESRLFIPSPKNYFFAGTLLIIFSRAFRPRSLLRFSRFTVERLMLRRLGALFVVVV